MCFSQYSEYAPRPVREEVATEVVRPEGAPPSRAEMDPNLLGPKPTPPEWQVAPQQVSHTHSHEPNGSPGIAVQALGAGATGIAGVSTQTVEAVVVELANGTKLLICPL